MQYIARRLVIVLALVLAGQGTASIAQQHMHKRFQDENILFFSGKFHEVSISEPVLRDGVWYVDDVRASRIDGPTRTTFYTNYHIESMQDTSGPFRVDFGTESIFRMVVEAKDDAYDFAVVVDTRFKDIRIQGTLGGDVQIWDSTVEFMALDFHILPRVELPEDPRGPLPSTPLMTFTVSGLVSSITRTREGVEQREVIRSNAEQAQIEFHKMFGLPAFAASAMFDRLDLGVDTTYVLSQLPDSIPNAAALLAARDSSAYSMVAELSRGPGVFEFNGTLPSGQDFGGSLGMGETELTYSRRDCHDAYTAITDHFDLSATLDGLPIPLGFTAERPRWSLANSRVAGSPVKTLDITAGVRAFALGDAVMALFDPQAAFPKAPAALDMAISASIAPATTGGQQLFGLPVALRDMAMSKIGVSAIGTTLSGGIRASWNNATNGLSPSAASGSLLARGLDETLMQLRQLPMMPGTAIDQLVGTLDHFAPSSDTDARRMTFTYTGRDQRLTVNNIDATLN